jgi:serine kinase of HPr protein (carbohydrate metabolism regulator)
MPKDKWTVDTATSAIERNGGTVTDDRVIVLRSPGNRLLGAIDFLVNHHKHRWVREVKK